MDYKKFCERCKHYAFSLSTGIQCGLTNQKPAFETDCEHFQLDPTKDSQDSGNQNQSDQLTAGEENRKWKWWEALANGAVGGVVSGLIGVFGKENMGFAGGIAVFGFTVWIIKGGWQKFIGILSYILLFAITIAVVNKLR